MIFTFKRSQGVKAHSFAPDPDIFGPYKHDALLMTVPHIEGSLRLASRLSSKLASQSRVRFVEDDLEVGKILPLKVLGLRHALVVHARDDPETFVVKLSKHLQKIRKLLRQLIDADCRRSRVDLQTELGR